MSIKKLKKPVRKVKRTAKRAVQRKPVATLSITATGQIRLSLAVPSDWDSFRGWRSRGRTVTAGTQSKLRNEIGEHLFHISQTVPYPPSFCIFW